MLIEEHCAIVTGGGSGLGAATARMLSDKGAKVIILDRDLAKAGNLAQEINAEAYACDISDAKVVDELFSQLFTNRALHICVNCAGVAPAMRVLGKEGPMPTSHFEDVVKINLLGTFYVMRAAYQAMIRNDDDAMNMNMGRGVIINTASVAAIEGQIGQVAYSASKGGVLGMMLPAAREFAKFEVRVNTIMPGIMGTPMMLSMPDKVQGSLLSHATYPKRYGSPIEFASLVCHIIENDYLNAATIRLDGAIRMPAK